MGDSKDNLLWISWHDSAWIPILNPTNVMDYFQSTTNPFYDRTCNNEIVKMQRLNMEHLNNLTGLEYMLLHVQEPILYVIRKQHRHSAAVVTPLADFYIIAGVVYQAPDLGSVINSRISTTVNHLQGAFDEARTYSRYHPSKGYWWEFKETESKDEDEKKAQKKSSKEKAKEESGSMFQRHRVNVLLADLAKKFPLKNTPYPATNQQPEQRALTEENTKVEVKVEVKTEPQANKPPPEKKPRLV
ncbi:mediator of RNA polymerase II transcription subunit 6-like [Daphnia pulex]|uniref:Mediator of RNA polymerase II transcription subunit 6 n=1 Tax=Daphnia pulex TaxID=6669 RepID=A0A4Y7MWX7_DAPPU|nr:mediator of RNA polymerase II transcription subunit 6-like [Daphnia pulex]CAG4640387.1 EOG090X0E0D [Daphnia pulex]SVE85144.1 EOG090X0E0D [Daphnia pulex]